jgi:hypothetical protein
MSYCKGEAGFHFVAAEVEKEYIETKDGEGG